jgi:hypothetical protein
VSSGTEVNNETDVINEIKMSSVLKVRMLSVHGSRFEAGPSQETIDRHRR